METVWLDWHGPFLLRNLYEYENSSLEEDAGVYVFLDSERLAEGWGNHKLLYVGMVYGRSFENRIPEHTREDDAWNWIERNRRGEVTAKIAIVTHEKGRNLSEQLVRDIENLLIFKLNPPANLQGIESYTGRAIRIINERRSNPIPPEVTFP